MEYEVEEMKAEAEKERVKMYIQYLSQVFAQPSDNKKFLRAKKEFEKMLMPDTKTGIESNNKEYKNYDWDFDPSEFIE